MFFSITVILGARARHRKGDDTGESRAMCSIPAAYRPPCCARERRAAMLPTDASAHTDTVQHWGGRVRVHDARQKGLP